MHTPTDRAREQRVAEVLSQAMACVPQGEREPFGNFVSGFFHHLETEDLLARSSEDVVGALLSCWRFAALRSSGQAQVRVFSPTVAEDGWTSRHTVVQLINDDMPFLVDSVTMEVNRQGSTVHLIVHPVLTVQRDADGVLRSVLAEQAAATASSQRESWMHVEVDRVIEPAQRAELLAGLQRVLDDVRAAVRDWQPMLQRLRAVIAELDRAPPGLGAQELDESRDFLRWLADDNFTFLGYRQHDLLDEDGHDVLRSVGGTALGLLRDAAQDPNSASFAALPPSARARARSPSPLLVLTRANKRSRVHRPGYTDYVGCKRYDAQGMVIGEHRFIGLYTTGAYSARVDEVPLLRGKVRAVVERAAFPAGGHLAKALLHLLASYPRDDLLQIGADDLYDSAMGILAASERQRLRLFVWRDPYERFLSCLIFVPRDAYNTELRMRLQSMLMSAFEGLRCDYDVQLGDAILARLHLNIRIAPGKSPQFDVKALETQLSEAARRWEDRLRDALVEELGEARGMDLFKRWSAAFPQVYRELHSPRAAVPDLLKIDALTPGQPLALSLYRPLGAGAGTLGFKVYQRGAKVVLSDSLPMLEHLGARVLGEDNFRIGAPDDAAAQAGGYVSMHDFQLEAQVADEIEADALARLFEDAFALVFGGAVESDDFNRLVLRAGLAAEDVVVLRAYAKYLKQIGFALSQATIEATLVAHPRLARMLISLFKLRLHPQAHDDAAAAAQVNAIEQALDKVGNLSEDRVLRQLLALVQCTLRTNHWRTGIGNSGASGERRSFLSFKLDSAKVPGLPAPRPMVEIFVYSPRFEGIHLRGGKVARGGLRWSDRPEDFRTEVLGLVKAQMVKNTVIVPVGSKGGFVLKKAPPSSQREAWLAEGVACYRDYLRGLLDLTDNLVAGQTVPPPLVRRMDGDDAYLVVAADKGTASFSDHANAISAEYDFWLGDAFASGGSVGYDHKGMGITARGAWESVKRHFRELGVDTQTTDFTVVGIGDMSGDVFGNGMLLSRHIRLVAAFDHRHVFIDPTPDASTSFAERKRLFELPRSSWADYDGQLISAGGGVWSRAEKSIPLSPQARAALDIDADKLTPGELINALLKAPVDLLYNGGIGTYVKAGNESHADVGDRANDGIRVSAAELRCKVLGEGGNLGCTQLGRIEAARAGVRLYTDAIDNSAGVDTSDHEVNIKILFGLAIADGAMTEKQRNDLLPQMTDDVAALVLADNYQQTQAISIAGRQAALLLDRQARFMRHLESIGALDRSIEFLPTDKEVAARKAHGEGLFGPECAVLLAYSKMWLSDQLIDSTLPEDPWVASALLDYFPPLLREKFAAWIGRHPLKREIIATQLLNRMVNRVGASFVHRLAEITGAKPWQIVRAYLAMREVFDYDALSQQIDALDNHIDDALQAALIIALKGLCQRATTWFLHPRRQAEPLQQLIERLSPAVAVVRERLSPLLAEAPQVQGWVEAGVPQQLAVRIAGADALFDALDIAEIAEATEQPLHEVAGLHYTLGERLGLHRLQQQIEALPAGNYWGNLAKIALGDDLSGLQRAIALEVLSLQRGGVADMLQAWEDDNRTEMEGAGRLVAELAAAPAADLAMLSVAMRKLRTLA